MTCERKFKCISIKNGIITEQPQDIVATSFEQAFLVYAQRNYSEHQAQVLWGTAGYGGTYCDVVLLNFGKSDASVLIIALDNKRK